MKIASLIVGILLMVLAGIAFIVCLLLPKMTNDRVNITEIMLGLILAVILFFLPLAMTMVSAIVFFKGKKTAQNLK